MSRDFSLGARLCHLSWEMGLSLCFHDPHANTPRCDLPFLPQNHLPELRGTALRQLKQAG